MSAKTVTKMAVYHVIYDRLVTATTMRGQRDGWVDGPNGHPECEWVRFERTLMHRLTNRFRADAGLDDVSLERVMWAERQAEGHSDYCQKFALHCAEIAVGER